MMLNIKHFLKFSRNIYIQWGSFHSDNEFRLSTLKKRKRRLMLMAGIHFRGKNVFKELDYYLNKIL